MWCRQLILIQWYIYHSLYIECLTSQGFSLDSTILKLMNLYNNSKAPFSWHITYYFSFFYISSSDFFFKVLLCFPQQHESKVLNFFCIMVRFHFFVFSIFSWLPSAFNFKKNSVSINFDECHLHFISFFVNSCSILFSNIIYFGF